MAITAGLAFDKWNEAFDDPVLTGAVADRAARKACIVDMAGESYRVLETEERMRGAAEAASAKDRIARLETIGGRFFD